MTQKELEILDVPHGEIIDMNGMPDEEVQKTVCSSKIKKAFLYTLFLLLVAVTAGVTWNRQK